ncbi:MAG TPA: ribonuclease III [Methylomirabilota bacterium]|nr:ribonuclease III [Methylomirabilota bacterium]
MHPATPPTTAPKKSFWSWLKELFARPVESSRERVLGAQEQRVLSEFCRQYGLPFKDLALLKLALTHRSYLSVTGQGPRESNERLEFLGDSVLGLVTSEFLYRRHPDEHEGQLTKTKSLLVSKAILSRRALRIGLGRFVLMSHSEVESGGRQRLSILADAFESVIGAVYLDQGFEPAREFIHKHLLAESDAITSDKRHTNYKSHLQEYVQNAFRTHPVYRIRSEYGPDHSKHFMVEVIVGKRTLGEGRGHNKKEAEQAAARDALEKVERLRRKVRDDEDRAAEHPAEGWDQPQERDEAPHAGRARREPRSRHEGESRGPRLRASGPAPVPPAPRDIDESDEEVSEPPVRESESDGDDPSERGRRRRRSRRGGRMRHGERGPRGAEGATREDSSAGDEHGIDAPEPLAPVSGERAPADRARAEAEADFETPHTERTREPIESDERDTRFDAPAEPRLVEWEERSPEPEPTPVANKSRAAQSRAMSFGRGRRRDAEGRARGESSAAPPAEPPAEERHVDVFGASPSPPEPVVDVTAEAGGEVENERDREARIDEMERALESFGRRRTSDYGRRGRRR